MVERGNCTARVHCNCPEATVQMAGRHIGSAAQVGWQLPACVAANDACLGIVYTPLACRPLLHALVSPGVAAGFGVEVDAVKCDKAAPFLSRCEAALRQRGVAEAPLPVPVVQCAPIEQVCQPCVGA